MKHVVILEEHPESALRPGRVYQDIAAAIEREADSLLPQKARKAVACPACGAKDSRAAFSKLGFAFAECRGCRTVFVSPRPTPSALSAYRANAESGRIWRESFYSPSDERLAKIFAPRAAWVADTTLEHELSGAVVDLKSRYPAFLSELARTDVFSERIVAGADDSIRPRLAACGFKELASSESGRAAAVCALEVLEESLDPAQDLAQAHELLAPRGLLFLTTRSANGFEFSMLRERSAGLLPPHHLNILSIDGLLGLLDRAGFEAIELSTPGQLDLDLVRRALHEDPGLELPPFIEDILRSSDDGARQAFQEFLQRARRSTHLRLVARKR